MRLTTELSPVRIAATEIWDFCKIKDDRGGVDLGIGIGKRVFHLL